MRGAPITGRLAAAALLAIAIALPLLVPTYYVQFATKVLIMGLLAMALNLVVGFGGLVSLCHAAFFGLAGYVLALAAPQYEAGLALADAAARRRARRRSPRSPSARSRCAPAASISSW